MRGEFPVFDAGDFQATRLEPRQLLGGGGGGRVASFVSIAGLFFFFGSFGDTSAGDRSRALGFDGGGFRERRAHRRRRRIAESAHSVSSSRLRASSLLRGVRGVTCSGRDERDVRAVLPRSVRIVRRDGRGFFFSFARRFGFARPFAAPAPRERRERDGSFAEHTKRASVDRTHRVTQRLHLLLARHAFKRVRLSRREVRVARVRRLGDESAIFVVVREGVLADGFERRRRGVPELIRQKRVSSRDRDDALNERVQRLAHVSRRHRGVLARLNARASREFASSGAAHIGALRPMTRGEASVARSRRSRPRNGPAGSRVTTRGSARAAHAQVREPRVRLVVHVHARPSLSRRGGAERPEEGG